jgi:hypothetical protein
VKNWKYAESLLCRVMVKGLNQGKRDHEEKNLIRFQQFMSDQDGTTLQRSPQNDPLALEGNVLAGTGMIEPPSGSASNSSRSPLVSF